jgi:hypothetical protein
MQVLEVLHQRIVPKCSSGLYGCKSRYVTFVLIGMQLIAIAVTIGVIFADKITGHSTGTN